jgi:hypothetical protein
MPGAVADGERSPVGAECKRAHRAGDPAEVRYLPGACEARPFFAERARVEEGDAAVVAADHERPPLRAQSVVEDTGAAAVQHGDRRWAAHECRQEIAAGGKRVIESDAFAGEQEGAVEQRLVEGLCSKPLGGSRCCLGARRPPFACCDKGGRGDRDKKRERHGEEAAQPSVRASLSARLAREGAAAIFQELALEPVQPRFIGGLIGPLKRCREAGAAIELARVSPARLPFDGRLGQMAVQASSLRVLLEPAHEPRPLVEERLVDELDGLVVDDEQSTSDEGRGYARNALVVVGVELRTRHSPSRQCFAVASGDESERDPSCD